MVMVISNKIILYAVKGGGPCPSTVLRFHRDGGEAGALEGIQKAIDCVQVR